MHYKDGQEAKLGDLVKFKTWHYQLSGGDGQQVEKTGILVAAHPAAGTCNGTIAAPVLVGYPTGDQAIPGIGFASLQQHTVTLGECELVARS